MNATFEIERDIADTKIKLQNALIRRNYVGVSKYSNRLKHLESVLADRIEAIKFDFVTKEQNKDCRGMAGKSLSLTINMADLAIYYLDVFSAYFRERGYIPVEEWENREQELRRVLTSFRTFSKQFFVDENARKNIEDTFELDALIRKFLFTAAELKYLDEYADKVN